MKNKFIKREAKSASSFFNQRSLATDFRTLLPSLKEGMRVLDVGCGTGAISAGVAKAVGSSGKVTGIDNTAAFITNGKQAFAEVKNLDLVYADIFDLETDEKFDLIIAARVLQWMSTPVEALRKMKTLLKPNGQISILDYDHTALELYPDPPETFKSCCQTWLQWRSDAGMNNQIALDLPEYFNTVGLEKVESLPADELYTKGEGNFQDKIAIWSKVIQLEQLVQENYLTQAQVNQAVADYEHWCQSKAERMLMKLSEIRGFRNA